MRKLICSVCGRPAAVGGFCEEHYTARHSLFDIEPFEVKVCSSCGAAFDAGGKRLPPEDAISEASRLAIRSHGKIEKLDIELKKVGADYIATVRAEGTIPPAALIKKEIKRAKIRVKRFKCPSCTKLLGRYHEAVVQIRGERSERLLELAEAVSGTRPKRAERLKYGWNLYFVNKADARAVVHAIEAALKRKKEKELLVIRSYKLVGKKLGKELWRDFYAIR